MELALKRLTFARLRGQGAMAAVGAVLVAVFTLSTVPTPLYVIYRQAFGFSELILTLVYAAYVIGSVAALFFGGRLSDQIGRRPVVLLSLGVAAAGDVLLLVASGTAWLFAGRVVSGLAIGLASGASTAWVVELEPHGDKAAGTRTAMGANMLGLGVGCLLAGALAQWAPAPLRLSYAVTLFLLAVAALGVVLTSESHPTEKELSDASLHPRLGVPRGIRAEFGALAVAAFATFAVLGFYTALIPSMLTQALHAKSHALAGGIVGGLFLVGTATIALARLKPRPGILVSLAFLVPGIAMLVLGDHGRSMPLLWAATGVGGFATGLGYVCGLQRLNEIAPADRRSEILSSYLLVCYAGISVPVVGIGVLETATNALLATTVFGLVVAALSLAALVFEVIFSRRRTV